MISPPARQLLQRLITLILIVLMLVGWLSIRPASPERVLGHLAALPCTQITSSAPETLVPTSDSLSDETPVAETWSQTQGDHSFEPVAQPTAFSLAWRIGISVPEGSPFLFEWTPPRPGWYLNWSTDDYADGYSLADLGMEFTPMVRLRPTGLYPDVPTLYRLAQEKPGQTWLIGNEPDVRWQDDASPDEYACRYFQAYQTIKLADPTAQIANGGVSQVTPVRLRYLEMVWESYREQFGSRMPVDIWTMHGFVLREEEGNWGVGLPPGFDGATDGLLWDVEDHDDLALVEGQVRQMRGWMADHGQREKMLYVTEYGILIPAEFGFTPTKVINFMIGSFELFDELRDQNTGYPPDDNRLVQRWVWFSTRNSLYPVADLFDADGLPLPPMRAMNGYIRAHTD